MNDAELEKLLIDLESDRVERKESISNFSSICQVVCGFANDLPNHRMPGVLFIGASDDGRCAGPPITDQLLLQLAEIRSSGNILPMPSLVVQKMQLGGGEIAVVLVEPSESPPVRYKGRVWIRVGPRRATATAEEERRLSEKRRAGDLPFDLQTRPSAVLSDLDLDLFVRTYLPSALASDVLAENDRSVEQQLRSVRFIGTDQHTPTVVGLLTLGKSPADFIPGGYVQFLRISGTQLSDPISDQKEYHGPLPELMPKLDDILNANIRVATDIESTTTEIQAPDYPVTALQQLIRNAVMHRDYETSNAPVRLTWFDDRIEIQNPGGPYGQVTVENFGDPGMSDYRNPNVAEVMRNLGYVQRFGIGIQVARKALEGNGNPPLDFRVNANHVLAIVRKS